jgi:hypothetical protein
MIERGLNKVGKATEREPKNTIENFASRQA